MNVSPGRKIPTKLTTQPRTKYLPRYSFIRTQVPTYRVPMRPDRRQAKGPRGVSSAPPIGPPPESGAAPRRTSVDLIEFIAAQRKTADDQTSPPRRPSLALSPHTRPDQKLARSATRSHHRFPRVTRATFDINLPNGGGGGGGCILGFVADASCARPRQLFNRSGRVQVQPLNRLRNLPSSWIAGLC